MVKLETRERKRGRSLAFLVTLCFVLVFFCTVAEGQEVGGPGWDQPTPTAEATTGEELSIAEEVMSPIVEVVAGPPGFRWWQRMGAPIRLAIGVFVGLLAYFLPLLVYSGLLARGWRPGSAAALCIGAAGALSTPIIFALLARVTIADYVAGLLVPWYRDFVDLGWAAAYFSFFALLALVALFTGSSGRRRGNAGGEGG